MPLDRASLDRLALDAAYQQALKSRSEGGIPIGSALMTQDGVIVALGHNLRVQTGDSTAHAETVCIRNAGRRRDWHTLTLASTLSPCAMCSGTAVLHRIPRVVIGENRTFQGREDWMRQEKIELVIADDPRCVALMRDFIAQHPELWNEDIGVPPAA
jgi:creatinine deaminase